MCTKNNPFWVQYVVHWLSVGEFCITFCWIKQKRNKKNINSTHTYSDRPVNFFLYTFEIWILCVCVLCVPSSICICICIIICICEELCASALFYRNMREIKAKYLWASKVLFIRVACAMTLSTKNAIKKIIYEFSVLIKLFFFNFRKNSEAHVICCTGYI